MPAQSTSEAVGDTAKAAIDALGLLKPGARPGTAVPVVKRKLPAVPEGDALGAPQVVVSVGEEGRTEYLSATDKLKTYPVSVTLVTAAGQQTGDDPTVRKWREQIERALDAWAAWAGLGGFSRVTITNKPPFDPAALPKDFNYAVVVAEVEVVEDRT